MSFKTEELLRQAEALPSGESSIIRVERGFSDEGETTGFFSELKQSLLDISHWNRVSGLSSYQLFDSSGRPASDHNIKVKSFIKIKLTGSGKSDWVRVEDIYQTENELVITVRPSYDPTDEPQQTGKTSHFFWSQATNNFCAVKTGALVNLYVIGLSERQNTEQTENVVETVRNAAVANLGYYLGIQKAQWTKFCKSFLFEDEESAVG